MIESDEALVLKSQKQDRAAFEELVRRTARLVYSRVYLAVGDVHRSEDLTQGTFMIAWRSIGQVFDAAGFRPWLLSIARTATIDAGRRDMRKKRSGPQTVDLRSFDLTDPRPDPAQCAQRQEQRENVLKLLQSLPEEYREPIMLRYIGGADYETIGRQLGLTNGSLRGLLSRGMSRLREQLVEISGTASGKSQSSNAKSQTSSNEERN